MIDELISWVSLLVGILSIVVSIFAIYLSHQSEKRQGVVFTQMSSLLHNIDKDSAIIKHLVSESNTRYLTILEKLTDPQRVSIAEYFKQETKRSV